MDSSFVCVYNILFFGALDIQLIWFLSSFLFLYLRSSSVRA